MASPQIPDLDFGWNATISQCNITATDIQRKFETLDPNKEVGPDDIPPSVLKYCAYKLAPHLAIRLSSLIAVGIFPSVLKRG